MEKDLILTCDAGTTGCKISVFSIKGEALFSVRRDYPTLYPKPNWSEQDPDQILSAVYDGIRELLQQVSPQRIACVGLCGAMNGCIPPFAIRKPLNSPMIVQVISGKRIAIQKGFTE